MIKILSFFLMLFALRQTFPGFPTQNLIDTSSLFKLDKVSAPQMTCEQLIQAIQSQSCFTFQQCPNNLNIMRVSQTNFLFNITQLVRVILPNEPQITSLENAFSAINKVFQSANFGSASVGSQPTAQSQACQTDLTNANIQIANLNRVNQDLQVKVSQMQGSAQQCQSASQQLDNCSASLSTVTSSLNKCNSDLNSAVTQTNTLITQNNTFKIKLESEVAQCQAELRAARAPSGSTSNVNMNQINTNQTSFNDCQAKLKTSNDELLACSTFRSQYEPSLSQCRTSLQQITVQLNQCASSIKTQTTITSSVTDLDSCKGKLQIAFNSNVYCRQNFELMINEHNNLMLIINNLQQLLNNLPTITKTNIDFNSLLRQLGSERTIFNNSVLQVRYVILSFSNVIEDFLAKVKIDGFNSLLPGSPVIRPILPGPRSDGVDLSTLKDLNSCLTAVSSLKAQYNALNTNYLVVMENYKECALALNNTTTTTTKSSNQVSSTLLGMSG